MKSLFSTLTVFLVIAFSSGARAEGPCDGNDIHIKNIALIPKDLDFLLRDYNSITRNEYYYAIDLGYDVYAICVNMRY